MKKLTRFHKYVVRQFEFLGMMVRFITVAVLMASASVDTLRVVEIYPWYKVPNQVCLSSQDDLPRKPLCKCWQSMTPKDWEDKPVLKWICNGKDPNHVVKDQPSYWLSFPPGYNIPRYPVKFQPPVQPTARPPVQPTAQPPVQPTAQPPVLPTAWTPVQPTARPPVQPTAQPPVQPTVWPFVPPTRRPWYATTQKRKGWWATRPKNPPRPKYPKRSGSRGLDILKKSDSNLTKILGEFKSH